MTTAIILVLLLLTKWILSQRECGTCMVEDDVAHSAAEPYFQYEIQSAKGCVAYDNCFYSVHVITVYEAKNRSVLDDHEPGQATVEINTEESEDDTRSFVLFLLSHEPIQWTLSTPQGVIFEKIIVGSDYIELTSVRGTMNEVLNVEWIRSCNVTVPCYADGYSYETVEQLQYVSNRYGPVLTWTSTYRADDWNLHIHRLGCTGQSDPTARPSAYSCVSTTSTHDEDISTPETFRDSTSYISIIVISNFLFFASIPGIIILKIYCRKRRLTETQQRQLQVQLISPTMSSPEQISQDDQTSPLTRPGRTGFEVAPTIVTGFSRTREAPPSYHEAVNLLPVTSTNVQQHPPPYNQSEVRSYTLIQKHM